MNTKRATGRFKLADKAGAFEAVFATLNTIDHDGDVTLPGAFTEGAPVRIACWGHRWDELPVGKGVIRTRGNDAIVEGAFFLNTQGGRETYETVKALGALQEWSYGYDVLDASPGQYDGQRVQFLRKLKVHEVSPVLLGAGIGTHTTAIKGRDHNLNPTSVLAELEMLDARRASRLSPAPVLAELEGLNAKRREADARIDAARKRQVRALEADIRRLSKGAPPAESRADALRNRLIREEGLSPALAQAYLDGAIEDTATGAYRAGRRFGLMPDDCLRLALRRWGAPAR